MVVHLQSTSWCAINYRQVQTKHTDASISALAGLAQADNLAVGTSVPTAKTQPEQASMIRRLQQHSKTAGILSPEVSEEEVPAPAELAHYAAGKPLRACNVISISPRNE